MKATRRRQTSKVSSQKARLVIDLIRGRAVSEAREFSRSRTSAPPKPIKILAIGHRQRRAKGASDNVLVDVDDLWVKECYADIGTTKFRRRVRPAPMGRAYRERRLTAISPWWNRGERESKAVKTAKKSTEKRG